MELLTESDIKIQCSLKSTYSKGEDLYENDAVESLSIEKTDDTKLLFRGEITGHRDVVYDTSIYMTWEEGDNRFELRRAQCGCPAFAQYGGFCKHLVAMAKEINFHVDCVEAENFLQSKSIGKKEILSNQDSDMFSLEDSLWSKEEKLPYPPTSQGSRAVATASGRVFSASPNVVQSTTSKELTDVMKEIAVEDRNQYCQVGSRGGDVELEVRLFLSPDDEWISFRIGRSKMYVVKDVAAFVSNVKNQNYIRYGKELEFVHSQSAFAPEVQPLLNFLLNESVAGKMDLLRPGQSTNKRYLYLEQWVMDELFAFCEGRCIQVENKAEKGYTEMLVKREDPKMPVRLVKEPGTKKVSVLFPEFYLLEGVRYIYVVWNAGIYICSEEYSKRLVSLLSRVSGNYSRRERAQMGWYSTRRSRFRKKQELKLHEKDYTLFCNTVLPLLDAYMDLHVEGIDFSPYEPEEGVCRVYLDIRSDESVICRGVMQYGKREHNLLQVASLHEAYRDIRFEYDIRTILNGYFPEVDQDGKEYLLREDDDRLAELVEHGISLIGEQAEVFVSEAFKRIRIAKRTPVTAGLSISGELLKVSWDVTGMSGDELNEILQAYHRKRKYFRLRTGELLGLQNKDIQVLADLQNQLHLTQGQISAGQVDVPMYRLFHLNALLKENTEHLTVQRDELFENRIKQFDELKKKTYPLPEGLQGELRGYQVEGYQWACSLAEFGFGGILADDMGLGKTLQMIAFLYEKKEGVHLVVTPASLVYNWEAECNHFAPDMKIGLAVGTAAERREVLEKYTNYDVVITSYDLLRRDIQEYAGKSFACQVVDEAQYIKNPSTQIAKAVKSIRSGVRFALTGTPVENRLSELWSIFEYLMPGYLYSYRSFRATFEEKILHENPEESKQAMEQLHIIISPFLLRRMKNEVLQDLPEKIEEVKYTRLVPEQEKIYRASEKRLLMSLGKKTGQQVRENKLEILAELTKLRQICCDPSLIYDEYKDGSAKLETCIQLIQTAIGGGHHLLVFSQFTSMLDVLEKRLKKEKISSFKFVGSTTKRKRKELVERFQNGEADVFLISLKAGGTGLNLTAADVVIHYDPWWNMAAQNQATDRTHRIGQENSVTVIRLIAKDTIEERILKLQEKKQDLANKVISAESVSVAALSKDELLSLFTKD